MMVMRRRLKAILIVVMTFILFSDKSTNSGGNAEVLIYDLVDDVCKLPQKWSIKLDRFNIAFPVLFDKKVYVEHIFIFPIEEEDLFVFDENPLVNLELFLFPLKNTIVSGCVPPVHHRFPYYIRQFQSLVSHSTTLPLLQSPLYFFQNHQDLAGVGWLEEKVVFKAPQTDHSLDLTKLSNFLL